jgi:hypothetical protein
LRRNWGALNFLKPEKFEKYRDEIRGLWNDLLIWKTLVVFKMYHKTKITMLYICYIIHMLYYTYALLYISFSIF